MTFKTCAHVRHDDGNLNANVIIRVAFPRLFHGQKYFHASQRRSISDMIMFY